MLLFMCLKIVDVKKEPILLTELYVEWYDLIVWTHGHFTNMGYMRLWHA